MATSPETQLFIHHCIGQRFMEESTFKEIFNRCFNKSQVNIDPELVTETISSINAALFSFGLELRSGIDEESEKLVWALVNTFEDEISQYATDYLSQELAYLNKLFEAIITDHEEQFFITLTDALNLQLQASVQNPEYAPSQLNTSGLTKAERSLLIETYIKDGWLTRTKLGYLTIGVRAILELKFKLKTQFEGYLFDCSLCEAPITQGLKCNISDCNGRFHKLCLVKTKSGVNRCLNCKADWQPIRIGPPIEAVFSNVERSCSATQPVDEQSGLRSKRTRAELQND